MVIIGLILKINSPNMSVLSNASTQTQIRPFKPKDITHLYSCQRRRELLSLEIWASISKYIILTRSKTKSTRCNKDSQD